MEQIYIDEALARLHDAESAIRRLQASVNASVSDENSSDADVYHRGKRQSSLRNGGIGNQMNHNMSLPKPVQEKPAEEGGTSELEPVSENRVQDDKPGPPPDAVIAEASQMRLQVHEDTVLKGKTVIWVRAGVCKLPFCHPESSFRLAWLICGMACTFVDAIFIPYTLAFEVQAEGREMRTFVDVFVLLDILFTFFSGYLDEMGVLITNPKQVWKRYLTTWFLFDVVAAFPWHLFGAEGAARLTRNIRVFRAFRLAKILRVVKLKYIMDKVEQYVEGNYLLVFGLAILRVLITLFMVCHWCSCLWFNSTKGQVEEGDPPSWCSHLPDNIQEMDTKEQHREFYLWSLYFTMTTMTTVGFGDITPTNTQEVHYCIIFLGISAIVFAGQLGILSDLISNLNTQAKVMREQKATLARYMNWRLVPKELRASIRRHCMFLWEKNEGNDAYEDTLKDFLPPVLRLELCYHIYGGVIQNAPFLAWMSDFPTVVKYLSNVIENTFWSRGDFIFRYDTLNHSIQLLLSGQVHLSRNERIERETHPDLYLPFEERFYVPNKNVKKIKEGQRSQKVKGNKSRMSLGARTEQPIRTNEAHKRDRFTWQNRVSPVHMPKNLAQAIGDVIEPITSAPPDDVLEPIFQSGMFVSSWQKLVVEDDRQVKAAYLLQCHWRKKRKSRQERGFAASGKWNQRTGIDSLQSYSVKAPAFFGESCLWQERVDGSCAKPYGYSARCEVLSETLGIDIKHIHDLLNRFSPWLQDRFERFRDDVSLHCAEKAGYVANENAVKAPEATPAKKPAAELCLEALSHSSTNQPTRTAMPTPSPESLGRPAPPPGTIPAPVVAPAPPPGTIPAPVPPETPPKHLGPLPPLSAPPKPPGPLTEEIPRPPPEKPVALPGHIDGSRDELS